MNTQATPPKPLCDASTSNSAEALAQTAPPSPSSPPPTFRALIRQLSEQLGRQHLPCHDNAGNLKEFLAADSVHAELANTIITTIYKASRCAHLDAPVRVLPVFEALGQLRGNLAQDQTTDIEQIALLERIGAQLRTITVANIADADTDSPPQVSRNAQQ